MNSGDAKEAFERVCTDFFYHNSESSKKVLEIFANSTILPDDQLSCHISNCAANQSKVDETCVSLGFVVSEGKYFIGESIAHNLNQIRNEVRKNFHLDAQIERNMRLLKTTREYEFTAKAHLSANCGPERDANPSNQKFVLESLSTFLEVYRKVSGSNLFVAGLVKLFRTQLKNRFITSWTIPSALLTEVAGQEFIVSSCQLLSSFCTCIRIVYENTSELVTEIVTDKQQFASGFLCTFQFNQSVHDSTIRKMIKNIKKRMPHLNDKMRLVGDITTTNVRRNSINTSEFSFCRCC